MDKKQDSPFKTFVKSSVNGGITGGLEICITFPTEYVKTQLQLDQRMGAARRYKGPIDCIKFTYRDYGLKGFYRGLSVLLAGSIPKSAIRFGSYNYIKTKFTSPGEVVSSSKTFCIGLSAGAMEAIFAVCPMENLKVKFMNDQIRPEPQFKGFIHGTGQVFRTYGVLSLWQGLSATILKQSSNQAIRFTVYENIKYFYREKYMNGNKVDPTPAYVNFFGGGFAGLVSVYCNTPVDVVKTRMQGLDAHHYKNFVDCFVKICKNEGIRGLYKGTVPRLSRVCLDVAITFLLFEEIKKILNRVW